MTGGRSYGGMTLLYAITVLAVIAGVFFRLKGLDRSPLAIDEYYIVTSTWNILQHGLPRLECGGYYVRGLLLQYMAAPFFLSGLGTELAFRLVTVAWSLAALPAIYLLARHLGGTIAACLAVIFASLSLWEVEFARFARMYAPFATLFLWHLYFLHRVLFLGDRKALKWVYLLSLVSIFVYAGAVFLIVLSFLPFFLGRYRPPPVVLGAPAALFALAFLSQLVDFRRLGAGEYLPAATVGGGEAGGGGLPVDLPHLLLLTLPEAGPWLAGFILLLACAVALGRLWLLDAWRAPAHAPGRIVAALWVCVGLTLAVLNLFGLLIGLAIGLFLITGVRPRDVTAHRLTGPTLACLLAILAYWTAYVLLADAWRVLFDEPRPSAAKDVLLVLFGYPNVLFEIILPWLRVMPVQTLVMAALIAWGVWRAGGKTTVEGRAFLFLAAVVIGLGILTAALAQPYRTTRYTYFLYPLLLILSAVALAWAANAAVRLARAPVPAAGIAALAFMAAGEDFQAHHLLNIDSDRVLYRMDFDTDRTDHFYARVDFRSPAEMVNRRRGPDDVVITTVYGVPHYLRQLDYLYIDAGNERFGIVAACGGRRDVWAGASLLRSSEELFAALGGARGAVWLITSSPAIGSRMPGERLAADMLSAYRVFQSPDGRIDVYRITPHEAAAMAGRIPASNGKVLEGAAHSE